MTLYGLRSSSSILFRTTTTILGRTGSGVVSSPKVAAFSTSNAKTPIRWGIVSAGKISSDYAKAIAITKGAEVAAVAARSLEKAESFAHDHDIPKAVGSYKELFQDPSIDVIYIGSIANEHYQLAAQSLFVGKKPTVVEKPLTLNGKDTRNLLQLAQQQNVFFMEGMWTRCFPALRAVRNWIDNGKIGKVVTIQADFGWSTKDCGPHDRIWNQKSGGMILDIGMYMIQLGQVGFAGKRPTRVQAMGSFVNGVDHTVLTNIQYGNSNDDDGGFLQFHISGEANTEERVVIQGTEGRIIIEPPAHIPTVVKLQADQGRTGMTKDEVLHFPLPDDSYTTWNYPGSIGFTHQIQAVGEALQKGERQCRHYTHSDSLEVAETMDQILEQLDLQQEEEKVSENDDSVVIA